MRLRLPERFGLLLILAVISVGAPSNVHGESIIVLRHAHKVVDGKAPYLTDDGENQARWIGHYLASQHIAHVFYAQDDKEPPSVYGRTHETAQRILAGLAEAGNTAIKAHPITPESISDNDHVADTPPNGNQFQSLKAHLGLEANKPADEVEIVIVHHEQIPALIDELTGHLNPKVAEIDIQPDDYGNIYILTRARNDPNFNNFTVDLARDRTRMSFPADGKWANFNWLMITPMPAIGGVPPGK